jgi:hypothetical protein
MEASVQVGRCFDAWRAMEKCKCNLESGESQQDKAMYNIIKVGSAIAFIERWRIDPEPAGVLTKA